MNRRISLLTIAVFLLCYSAACAADEKSNDDKKKPAVVPVFTLDQPYAETPMGDDPFFGAAGMESFQQLTARLEKARDDDEVKAIVILADAMYLGNAQLEELRSLMDELKAKGKEIHTHTESISMQQYVLLSGATKVSVVPVGDIWLTGLYAQSVHVRGLLELLGVEPDYLTCGDYKSAAELFTRREPSKEADENLNWLLDGIYGSYVELISQGREKSEENVRGWIDTGLFTPEKAKELGIIDAVEYRHEFVAELKKKFGDDLKFEKKYGQDKELEIDLSSPFGVLKFYGELLSGGKKKKSDKEAVAIVHVEGPILPGNPDPGMFPFGTAGIAYSTPIRKALEKAADDDSIKAVVLRVNSPGGSAVASEVILEATRQVKEKKPLVVSMGDVAGSGGYYVACGTDTIFADPTTITASIGVVAGKLVTKGLWDRIGVNWVDYGRGGSAGLLASSNRFTEKQRETLQEWMNEVYDDFKDHVREARKDKLTKDLEEMAGGRVYTGKQALELGLVDKLGGLNDAIAFAAKEASVDDYEIRVLPRPKNFAEVLSESLTGEKPEDDGSISLNGSSVADALNTHSLAKLIWAKLDDSDPRKAAAMRTVLNLLRVLERENMSMAMPVYSIGGR